MDERALTLTQAQLILKEAPLDETEEDAGNTRLAYAGQELRVRDRILVLDDAVGDAVDLLGLSQGPVALLTGQFKCARLVRDGRRHLTPRRWTSLCCEL